MNESKNKDQERSMRVRIGKNVQRLRKERGYSSAAKFAAQANFSPSSYTDYEQGRSALSLDKAWLLADVLECSLDELAGRQWPPEGSAAVADPGEGALVSSYRALNEEGREVAVNVVKGMVPAYPQKSPEPQMGQEAPGMRTA